MIENKITSSFQMNFITLSVPEFSITQSQTLSTTREIADRIWVTLKPAGTILLLRHMKGPGEIPIYKESPWDIFNNPFKRCQEPVLRVWIEIVFTPKR